MYFSILSKTSKILILRVFSNHDKQVIGFTDKLLVKHIRYSRVLTVLLDDVSKIYYDSKTAKKHILNFKIFNAVFSILQIHWCAFQKNLRLQPKRILFWVQKRLLMMNCSIWNYLKRIFGSLKDAFFFRARKYILK